MSNQSSTTTINTPKEELNQIMIEMFMMIEEMDIQEGKYLEFAEMFKSMNLNIDRLAGMRNQIIVNTYYRRYVRPQTTVNQKRLTEAEKEKKTEYSLCNCGRYVSNVTPKFALKHLNTAVHYQGVRNRKYAHTTFNNEEINDKIKTEVVIQCFIIKHLIEVKKLTAEEEEKEKTDIVKICVRCKYLEPHAPFGDADGTFGDCGHEYMNGLRLCKSCVESNRVQRGLDEEEEANCFQEEEDTGEIYIGMGLDIGMPTLQMGLDMLSDKTDEKEDEKEELSVAEEFRQGLYEPEEEELSDAEEFRRDEMEKRVKVNELIKFNYESRCKGVGVYRQYQGVIEKNTKKTMTIGGHTYKKEKMDIVAVWLEEKDYRRKGWYAVVLKYDEEPYWYRLNEE